MDRRTGAAGTGAVGVGAGTAGDKNHTFAAKPKCVDALSAVHFKRLANSTWKKYFIPFLAVQ